MTILTNSYKTSKKHRRIVMKEKLRIKRNKNKRAMKKIVRKSRLTRQKKQMREKKAKKARREAKHWGITQKTKKWKLRRKPWRKWFHKKQRMKRQISPRQRKLGRNQQSS